MAFYSKYSILFFPIDKWKEPPVPSPHYLHSEPGYQLSDDSVQVLKQFHENAT